MKMKTFGKIMARVQKSFKLKPDDDLFEFYGQIYICRQEKLYKFNLTDQTMTLICQDIPKKVHKFNKSQEIFMFVGNRETNITNTKANINLPICIGDKVDFRENMILCINNDNIMLYEIAPDLTYNVRTRTFSVAIDDLYFSEQYIYYHYDRYKETCILDQSLTEMQHISLDHHEDIETLKFIPDGSIRNYHQKQSFTIEIDGYDDINIRSPKLIFRHYGARLIQFDKLIRISFIVFGEETWITEEYSYPANFANIIANEELLTTFHYLDKNNEPFLAYIGKIQLPQDFAMCSEDFQKYILFLAISLRRKLYDKSLYCRIIDLILADDEYWQLVLYGILRSPID